MSPFDGLTRALSWSVRKILSSWVKATIKPEAAAAIAACSRPVCYVLERESHADLAVLGNACVQLNLPRPERRLAVGDLGAQGAYFELLRRTSRFSARSHSRAPR